MKKKGLLASLAATAIFAGSLMGASSVANAAERKVTVWSNFKGDSLALWNASIAKIEKANPGLKVTSVGSIDMAKSLAAINAGNGPDISVSSGAGNLGWFCGTGAWQKLNVQIAGSNGLKLNSVFTPPAINYSTSGTNRCALPAPGGTETFGFYWNKKLLKDAGYTTAPRTTDELLAYSKKLTTFNSDGSIKTAGFVPWAGYASNDMDAMWLGWMFGARWFNGDGTSGFSADAKWTKAFTWQKNFIAQVYGGGNYATGMKKVQKFVAGAGDFWGGDNDFVKGRVAMMTFADWMSQMFCDLDWNLNPCTKPVVNFGVSPIPVDASIVSSNYGSGPVGGALMGISKGSKNVKDAWIVLKGLATDADLSLALSNMTGSVPSLTSVLKSPDLKFPAFYKAWFDIAAHPKSGWHQLRNTGEHEEEKEANDFMAAWQAGQVPNLKTGLAGVTQSINTILSKNHA